jgi:hypothetical protein
MSVSIGTVIKNQYGEWDDNQKNSFFKAVKELKSGKQYESNMPRCPYLRKGDDKEDGDDFKSNVILKKQWRHSVVQIRRLIAKEQEEKENQLKKKTGKNGGILSRFRSNIKKGMSSMSSTEQISELLNL